MEVIYAKFNRERLPQYQISTIIYKQNSVLKVKKKAINPIAKKHIKRIYDNFSILNRSIGDIMVKILEIKDEEIVFEFFNGKSYKDYILQALEDKDKEKFFRFLRQYTDFLLNLSQGVINKYEEKKFVEIFDMELECENSQYFSSMDIDMTIENVLVDDEGNHKLIDCEWVFDIKFPVKFVVFRSLYILHLKYKEYLKKLDLDFDELLVHFEITANLKNKFIIMEEKFQEYVHGEKRKYMVKSNYVKAVKNNKPLLVELDEKEKNLKYLVQLNKEKDLEIENKEKNLQYLIEVSNEKENVIQEKENVIQEKEEDINSKSQEINFNQQIMNLNQQMMSLNKQIINELRMKIRLRDRKLKNLRYEIGLKDKKLKDEITLNNEKFEELNNIIKYKDIEISEKENNCRYLMELNEEKKKELILINDSRAWKIICKYRGLKNKVEKVIKNPSLILKKIKKYKKVNETKDDNLVHLNTDVVTSNLLISVVIPIYDRTEVLIESIESILNQTFQNFELLLICDGSPVKTLEIVQSYENHPKIRAFYYNNNSGNAVRGRNKGIKEALGKYLAFHDSDDVADKDRLKISVEYMEKYNVDIIYGGWRALVDGTRVIDIKNGQEVFSPECDYEMLRTACVPCQSTVMAKVDVLQAVGGLKNSMRYREDHELWLRIAYKGYKFKAIPRILTNLRLHENNLELKFKVEDNHWYDLMLEEHMKISPLMPKIAYVIPGCGISGGIAVICQHLNRLLDRGYDVLLISEDENITIPWFPNQKVQVLSLDKVPSNLDIVVATGWSTAHTIQRIKAKRKFYFVQSDESRFYPIESKEYELALETYDFDFEFMTEAKWIQKWLKEKFNKDAYYVPNGLDEQIIYKVAPIVSKSDKVRVLLEGPIDIPFKGMEDAFNAINGLDCEVWCISSAGKPKSSWKCDMFFEKVPMNKMKDIYSSCDILLKMSRVEGFFGPPLEMMACGGVCVVAEVTGYDEYIVDGYNALVVKPGDVEGARSALQKLIIDKDLRGNLEVNGQKTAEAWRWGPTIDELECIFYGKNYIGG